MRYIIFVSLASLLLSCQTTVQKWRMDTLKHHQYAYNSKRLVLPSTNPVTEPEVEIVKNGDGVQCYINCLSLPVTADEEQMATLSLHYSDKVENIPCFVMKGGQKLLICDTDAFLSRLTNADSCLIVIEHYRKTILNPDFKHYYKKI